jgi:hypothetical protein
MTNPIVIGLIVYLVASGLFLGAVMLSAKGDDEQ